MAKKKVTHQAKEPKQQTPPQSQDQPPAKSLSCQPSMEHPAEKLQSLKSLNSLLLKETFERRQQVESLVQAKEALESELVRSGMEKKELEDELARVGEENVGLELEIGLFCVLVKTQMSEIGVGVDGLMREKSDRETEIGVLKKEMSGLTGDLENERDRLSRVSQERDLIKRDLDFQVKEANGLKEQVIEMEKKERNFEEEIFNVKKECRGLIRDKEERERAIEVAKRVIDSVKENLAEKVKEIEGLKRENGQILKEKEDIELEKSEQKDKIDELEKEVENLNEIVLDLRKGEQMFRSKVFELEKNCDEALEEQREMTMEINALVGEKTESQRDIEGLLKMKESTTKMLEMTARELQDKEQLVNELVQRKNEIDEVKFNQEQEIVELHEELGELSEVLFSLKASYRDQEEKNMQLISEVSHFKEAFDRVMLERDDAQKGFDGEKKNGMNLRLKVLEMEKRIAETVEEMAQMRSERENLIMEKKEMENRFELLTVEKDLSQKRLKVAEQGIADLRAKTESSIINSVRALTMLKNTSALVCQSNDDGDVKKQVVINDRKIEDEIQPYEAELEVIRSAFKHKETMVEDMKREVELLQNSVADARKKKSFWTMVSSATTIFAAASVAYVARGR